MAAFLLFFIETKIGRTIAITGLIVAGVFIGWISFKNHYYNQGYQAAITQVAKNTKEAKDAVDKAVSSSAECFARGGTPDDTTGVCDR
jgi:predicted negative regulator of RcsB-dependent stress response